LAAADAVGVRDARTLSHLAGAGIAARLIPDPAVVAADLFGARIRAAARRGDTQRMREAFPQGWLAVQFSADFADDATLRTIAAQLGRIVAREGVGIVLFRAGAAPWHDDLDALQRVAARMRPGTAAVAESLDVWDLCALVAGSRGFCGSSLHGRILAMAY